MNKNQASILTLVFLVACGGGSKSTLPPPPDALDVPKETSADTVNRDITEVDKDQGPADDVGKEGPFGDSMEEESPEIGKDMAELEALEDSEGSEEDMEVLDGGEEEEVASIYHCSCDPGDNKHKVCGKDNNTYPNVECAMCALCKSVKGFDECDGCRGEIENCDPSNPDGEGEGAFLKQRSPCSACGCTQEELQSGPVCGKCTHPKEGKCVHVGEWDNGWAETYSNLCELKRANGCPDDPVHSSAYLQSGECEEAPCLGCDNTEIPVCGNDGITYKNKCWLNNCPMDPNATMECGAPCLSTKLCPMCISQQECDVVCGLKKVGGREVMQNYYNTCAAQCAGATIKYHGSCCFNCASLPKSPVCALDKEGKAVTLDNECELKCTGFTLLYKGACMPNCNCSQGKCECTCEGGSCSCDCSNATDGVCAGPYGETWPDQCWLTCLNLQKLHDGKCNYLCETCPREFEPVCAIDKSGRRRTFQNECFAKCAGATGITQGECAACTQQCGTPDDPKGGHHPVCGKEDHVTYPNECFALNCVGISKEDLMEGACSNE